MRLCGLPVQEGHGAKTQLLLNMVMGTVSASLSRACLLNDPEPDQQLTAATQADHALVGIKPADRSRVM